MAIERTAVRSRDLALVGYDQEAETLEVTFRQGGVYHYEKVPSSVYEELLKAESHGIYFNQKIKDQYTTKRIR